MKSNYSGILRQKASLSLEKLNSDLHQLNYMSDTTSELEYLRFDLQIQKLELPKRLSCFENICPAEGDYIARDVFFANVDPE